MQTKTLSAPSPSPTALPPPQTAMSGLAGHQAHRADSATNAGEIAIPDLDSDGPHEDEERIAQGLGRMSLGGVGGGS